MAFEIYEAYIAQPHMTQSSLSLSKRVCQFSQRPADKRFAQPTHSYSFTYTQTLYSSFDNETYLLMISLRAFFASSSL